MKIGNMTVKDARAALSLVEGIVASSYRDVAVWTPGNGEMFAGKIPFFTGLKPVIVKNGKFCTALAQGAEDEIVSGKVKLMGQWIWMNPNQDVNAVDQSNPNWWGAIYVSVPVSSKGDARGIGAMNIGDAFEVNPELIDPNDTPESVRTKILEARDRIYEMAAEYGIIEKAA